ncbi:hypothetical protein [Spelaeicoccus albus]|uniref:Putative membrane protein n=1 Tax=Spelaeicoccus albus TaxID=1280376 RepID=A0A7Z0IHW0_9MICO|nr:hypothetical protein [Spelaeicoccus albus]NYI67852.1 putative membrane protein [Spelaeicoccus albus]
MRRADTPSRKQKSLWLILCLLPVIAAFALQWLPIFNGPYLFLGMPTILWWSCIPGSALVTLVLVLIEKTRPDLGRQDELDDRATRAAEAREAEAREKTSGGTTDGRTRG